MTLELVIKDWVISWAQNSSNNGSLGLFTVAILGSFLAHFQTHFRLIFVYLAEEQKKGTKNGMENDVKNSYRETPGKENGAKMHFYHQEHCQKDEKWTFFRFIFAKARLGFHFLFIFLSFSVSILRKMEMENDWKMIEKWTKNANCEQPYY